MTLVSKLRQKDDFKSHNFVILFLPISRVLHCNFTDFKSFFVQVLLTFLVYVREV